jgi:DNA-directed RNA polymerase subunit RPC12/RpoP
MYPPVKLTGLPELMYGLRRLNKHGLLLRRQQERMQRVTVAAALAITEAQNASVFENTIQHVQKTEFQEPAETDVESKEEKEEKDQPLTRRDMSDPKMEEAEQSSGDLLQGKRRSSLMSDSELQLDTGGLLELSNLGLPSDAMPDLLGEALLSVGIERSLTAQAEPVLLVDKIEPGSFMQQMRTRFLCTTCNQEKHTHFFHDTEVKRGRDMVCINCSSAIPGTLFHASRPARRMSLGMMTGQSILTKEARDRMTNDDSWRRPMRDSDHDMSDPNP